MKPLLRVIRDDAARDEQRTALLSKPAEFFGEAFAGRTPSAAEISAWIETTIERLAALELYQNDLYSVTVERSQPFIRLTISRLDGQPFKTWKHLQEIKNQLIGPEHEAAELFPAQSRMIDGVNHYHLWVHANPNFRFPFGFRTNRVVIREAVRPLEGPTPLRRDEKSPHLIHDAQGTLT